MDADATEGNEATWAGGPEAVQQRREGHKGHWLWGWHTLRTCGIRAAHVPVDMRGVDTGQDAWTGRLCATSWHPLRMSL